MFRFVTAGESHGQALIAWISGVPAGVPIDFDFVQRELHRRQLGYGRGEAIRSKKTASNPFPASVTAIHRRTHRDGVEIATGPTGKRPFPSKISRMATANERRLTSPRPGHADPARAMKFNFYDAGTSWSAPRRGKLPRA